MTNHRNIINKILTMVVGLFTLASPTLAYGATTPTSTAANKETTEPSKTVSDAPNTTPNTAPSKTDEAIDNASEKIKAALKACGDKIEEAQEYLENYDWKGLIPKPTSGPASVTDATFNGNRVACIVKPGDRIDGTISVSLDPEQIKDIKFRRFIIGFKDIGAQTSFGVVPGVASLPDAEQNEKFTLIAPKDTGFYQVRFRPVESLSESDALKQWTDAEGKQPGAASTIGFIWVKE